MAIHDPHHFALSIESSNPSASGVESSGGMGVAIARIQPAGSSWQLAEPPVLERLRERAGREDDVMPAIDRLVNRIGATPDRIALVAVSIGPGGFTALRVAVTIAKSLSFASGALCVGVPTACVVARRAQMDSAPVAVLLSGKGESAFATVFDAADLASLAGRGTLKVPEGRIVRAADLEGLGVRSIIADQFVPASILESAERLGMTRTMPHYDAGACLEIGVRLPTVPADRLAPIYPREPEAVVKWRQLHPGR